MRFLSPVTHLGMRLLARVLFVYSLLAIVLIGINGYFAWQTVSAAQTERLREIRENIVTPLINDIWQFDDAKIRLQLEVISRMLPQAAVRLETTELRHFRAGAASLPANATTHQFELRHPLSQSRVGTLSIALDPRHINQAVFEEAIKDFFINLALMLLFAVALGFFVHSLIVRRLQALSEFARTFDPDASTAPTLAPLPTPDTSRTRDEIDDLASAFERMRLRIFDDILASRALQTQLTRQALHDALTGLGNRTHLAMRAKNILLDDNTQGLAFVFIDVDRLKLVNDTLGHIVGDHLLRALARRMEAVLPERVELFRPGSDEFLLLIPNPNEEPTLAQITADLQKIMSVPFQISPHELSITVSIGAAIDPEHGDDQSILLRHADIALQAAKRIGRGSTCLFNPGLLDRLNERVQLESLLRTALDRGELSVHFQPQIDLASKRLIGAEALLRWNNLELGAVSPDRFIPIAEDSGLIVEIGAWVLRTSCREARRWLDAGLDDIRLSVNLSAVQLRHPGLARTIADAIRESRLPEQCLEIEVTESVIMDDVAQAAEQLAALRALGLRIAIDDFGTGYSSMAYLKHLPIDSLKIDRAFITDIPGDSNDTAIAIAIIRLAEALNLTVIAEGVENIEQADLLLGERCQVAQGFYFARPMPATQFMQFALDRQQNEEKAQVSRRAPAAA